jgi:carbamoyl-phosphate synthase large subunit
MPDNMVLIDQFLERAKEAEIDAIYDGEDLCIMGIMEHIEPAGIHSGDSSAMLPTYSLSDQVLETMKEHALKLAKALDIRVPMINIQFAIKNEQVYVIEANPRAMNYTFHCKGLRRSFLKYRHKNYAGNAQVERF